MKKVLKTILVAGAALALSASVLAGCTSGDQKPADKPAGSDAQIKLIEDGKLTIGSDLDYMPMEYLKDNKPAGFGVAMMEEICKRLDLEMNFLGPQNFDTLITQVNAGNTMDVACSSITITDERAELVAFSDAYYDSNLAIVTMADTKIASKDDLNSKDVVVAAQSGSSGEDWIKENLPNAELVQFTGPTDAVNAMISGKCVAVVYDQPVAEAHVAKQFKQCKVLDIIPTGEQYGLAINKENTALLEAVNKALADMQADGTMDSIRAEFFGK